VKRDRRDFIKLMTSSAIAAALVPGYVSGGEEKKAKPAADDAPQMSRGETALALMGKYGSCCSGVLGAYAGEFGLDDGHVAGLGRGMAGGIGGLGNVCGAVSGAILVIGLKTTSEENLQDMDAGFETMAKAREFVDRFEKLHSSIQCRELIGHDISSREKSEIAMKEGAFANCPGYVASAATILDEMFPGG
jgi:C_GCAxxG_C_C family probable redox protein